MFICPENGGSRVDVSKCYCHMEIKYFVWKCCIQWVNPIIVINKKNATRIDAATSICRYLGQSGKKKIHFLNLFVHHQLSTLINTRSQTQLWGSKNFLKNAIQLRNLSRQKWIIVTKTIMNKKYPGILLRLANELENKLVRGQRLQSLLTQCPLLWERTIWIETYSSSLSFTTFFALPR